MAEEGENEIDKVMLRFNSEINKYLYMYISVYIQTNLCVYGEALAPIVMDISGLYLNKPLNRGFTSESSIGTCKVAERVLHIYGAHKGGLRLDQKRKILTKTVDVAR